MPYSYRGVRLLISALNIYPFLPTFHLNHSPLRTTNPVGYTFPAVHRLQGLRLYSRSRSIKDSRDPVFRTFGTGCITKLGVIYSGTAPFLAQI